MQRRIYIFVLEMSSLTCLLNAKQVACVENRSAQYWRLYFKLVPHFSQNPECKSFFESVKSEVHIDHRSREASDIRGTRNIVCYLSSENASNRMEKIPGQTYMHIFLHQGRSDPSYLKYHSSPVRTFSVGAETPSFCTVSTVLVLGPTGYMQIILIHQQAGQQEENGT